MTNEQKDKLWKIATPMLASIAGACVATFLATSYTVKAALKEEVKSKASIIYVDSQNKKQNEYIDDQNRKQDERIDRVDNNVLETKAMVTDIWKTLYLEKNNKK